MFNRMENSINKMVADNVNSIGCFLSMGGFIREAARESILEEYSVKVKRAVICMGKLSNERAIEIAEKKAIEEVDKALNNYNPKTETRELIEVLDQKLDQYIAKNKLSHSDEDTETANGNNIYFY